MQIVTNGRNIELTDAIKSYVQQKVSRLEKHFDFILEVHVILEVEKNPRISANQLAEATVHVTGAVIRVEAASENLYASIDKLVDKIERSVQKHKSKLMSHGGKHNHGSIRKDGLPEEADTEAEGDEDEDFQLNVTVTEEEEEGVEVVETQSP